MRSNIARTADGSRDSSMLRTLARTFRIQAIVTAFVLRKVNLSDRDSLRELIAISAIELSRGYYKPEQVTAALQGAFGVDTSLIDDGTYFVAQAKSEVIGCGGWSKRRTMFGGDKFPTRDAALLDPAIEAARIRAF